jgi:2-keto-4-pentenoate hydratase/2-oxohepta-3-ene-1,7-dioic acid hydratase in catechol pathway
MFTPLLDNQHFEYSIGKILCIGRNYAAHAAELNNPVPDTPVLFLKPADAACDLRQPIAIPENKGSVHHELELAILIGRRLTHATPEQVQAAVAGIGLGLDLTLRDIQSELKDKGLPWERAKAFDGSCPLTPFVSTSHVEDWQALNFTLERNGTVQQVGNSRDMLYPVLALIAHMSESFTLNPGDVVMTGTPKGVGPLTVGDNLEVILGNWLACRTRVIAG